MGYFLKGLGVFLAFTVVIALALAWFYGLDSHHASRDSIWPERGRNLIPPTATDITLHRDLLTHWATYTVSEEDLNEFFEAFEYVERTEVDPARVGEAIGRFDWVVTEESVHYHFTTSNGAGQSYTHDPTTGLTYQVAQYW